MRPAARRALARVEQTLSIDDAGVETVEREVAMAADRFLLKFSGAPAELQQRLGRAFPELPVGVKPLSSGWVAATIGVRSLEDWRDVAARLAEIAPGSEAEPDYIAFTTELLPDDPRFESGEQWSLDNRGGLGRTADSDIDATEAWALRTDASSVIVGVIDTGIRYTHEDLAANMWTNPGEIPGDGIDNDGNGVVDDIHGYDSVSNDGDPLPDDDHGTHVAGTIGAAGDNGIGISGVVWKTQLMAVDCFSGGWALSSDLVEGIDYAVAHGAMVLNNSWGSNARSQAIFEAFERAQAEDVVIVAAAGNSSMNSDSMPFYPAGFELANLVSVGSSDSRDDRSFFSNYGEFSVHLFAPGSDILSAGADSDDAYLNLSGTSMASPHVAGAIAALMAEYPDEGARSLIARLIASADDREAFEGRSIAGGRLNLARALEMETAPTLPEIIVDSGEQLVLKESSVELSASITGVGALSLQWYKDGQAISGATDSRLEIASVDESTAGSYYLVVRSALGAFRSAEIRVDFKRPPTIVRPPAGVNLLLGETASFRVSVSGTAPFAYQWMKDGAPIPGETGEMLYIGQASEADVGVYAVVVTNELGSAESLGAPLAIVERRDRQTWTPTHPQPIAANLYSVCYGAGLFVATGSGGAIYTSPDGESWTRRYVNATGSIAVVERLGDQFLAAAQDGKVFLSDDGCRWREPSERPSHYDLRALATDGSRIVMGGHYAVGYSDDHGETWTTLVHEMRFSALSYAEGLWVGVSIDGEVSVSPDAETWETQTLESARLYAIARDENRWLAAGSANDIAAVFASGNGRDWTQIAEIPEASVFWGFDKVEGGWLGAGGNGELMFSQDGAQWSFGAAVQHGLQDACFGSGKYVVVGGGSTALATDDPLTWPLRGVASLNRPRLARGTPLGYFAAGGIFEAGALLRSENGLDWRATLAPGLGRVADVVAHGASVFALEEDGGVLRTDNGARWEAAIEAGSIAWRVAASDAGEIWAFGVPEGEEHSAFYRSTDGSAWTQVAFPSGYEINSIARFKGAWLAGGTRLSDNKHSLLRQDKLGAWVDLELNAASSSYGIHDIAVGNGIAVASSWGNSVFRSEDGLNWETFHLTYSMIGQTPHLAFGDGVFLRGLDTGRWEVSVDGRHWSLVEGYPTGWLLDVAYGPEGFVGVGTGAGDAWLSRNGYEWETRELQTTDYVRALFEAEGRAVAVTYSAAVMIEGEDGHWTTSWIPQLGATSGAYGDGVYVVTGHAGVSNPIMASEDGVNWVKVEALEEAYLNKIARLNGAFVGVGWKQSVVSIDGSEWTRSAKDAFEERVYLTDVEFGEGLYVAVGGRNDDSFHHLEAVIYSSTDGLAWTQRAAFPETEEAFSHVVYGNGRFLALASQSAYAISEDGVNWSQRQMPPSYYPSSLTFADGQFFALGAANAAYVSTDGETWTRIPTNISDFFPDHVESIGGSLYAAGLPGYIFKAAPDELIAAPSILVAHWGSEEPLQIDLARGRSDLSIAEVGEAQFGFVEIVSVGEECEPGTQRALFTSADFDSESRDTFSYRLANAYGVESATGEVSVTRRPPLALQTVTHLELHKSAAMAQFALPLSAENRIASASTASGSGNLEIDGRVLRYYPSGEIDEILTVVFENGEPDGQGHALSSMTLRLAVSSPLASKNDFAVAGEETLIPILANDTLPNGARVAILEIIDGPTGGVAWVVIDNDAESDADRFAIRYKPAAGYKGSDRIVYRITDDWGDSAQANIEIYVAGTDYAEWAESHLDEVPEADRLPLARAFGNAFTNLEVYAFGLDPRSPFAAPDLLPHVFINENRIGLRARLAQSADLTYTLEVFDNDKGWRDASSSLDGLAIHESPAEGIDYPLVPTRLEVDVGDSGARLIRLRVEIK